jgi:hypothetical protein
VTPYHEDDDGDTDGQDVGRVVLDHGLELREAAFKEGYA